MSEEMKDTIEGFCLDAMNRKYAQSPQLFVDTSNTATTKDKKKAVSGKQIAS